MKLPPRRALLIWAVGPALVFALAGWVGHQRAGDSRGEFYRATSALSQREVENLEAAPALAAANAAWALGDAASVKKTIQSVLRHVPETDRARRAQALIRFGIIDSNYDGQAAVFAQACALDASACDAGLKAAAERETKARFVSPGSRLPLYFLGGHPPIPGSR